MLKVLAALLVIALMIYGWYRNDQRRLTRDYACKIPFKGPLQPCVVRFPTDEAGTDCLLGVNSEGLYMSSSVEAVRKRAWWSSSRRYVIRTPLLIPWLYLEIEEAKFPMHGHLRFNVTSNGTVFFVPRETGNLLLRSVGRAI
jgi:hypothetical protein